MVDIVVEVVSLHTIGIATIERSAELEQGSTKSRAKLYLPSPPSYAHHLPLHLSPNKVSFGIQI